MADGGAQVILDTFGGSCCCTSSVQATPRMCEPTPRLYDPIEAIAIETIQLCTGSTPPRASGKRASKEEVAGPEGGVKAGRGGG